MPPWVVNLCVEWRHLLFHSAKWCQSLSASSVQETHQVQCGQFQSGSSCKRFTHFVAGWNFLKRSLPSFLKMEFEGGGVVLKFHFKIPFLQSCGVGIPRRRGTHCAWLDGFVSLATSLQLTAPRGVSKSRKAVWRLVCLAGLQPNFKRKFGRIDPSVSTRLPYHSMPFRTTHPGKELQGPAGGQQSYPSYPL